MDYKYIEQLLERFWNCETTLEEEAIIRAFFAQKEIPEHLVRYKSLFQYEQTLKEAKLSDDFDKKVLALTEEKVTAVKARRITYTQRLMPLYKSAAVIAMILTLGNAAQKSVGIETDNQVCDYNYETYQDTYKDPEVAYNQISSALKLISESLAADNDSVSSDSVQQDVDKNKTTARIRP